jgi:hypothetical protein
MESFEDFLKQFTYVQGLGYVETKRKNNTGIGFTLETLLGLEENSYSLPDLFKIYTELKAKRLGCKCLLTLYTDESGWLVPQIDFLEKYGWGRKKEPGELTVGSTIKIKPNKRGFSLDITDSDYFKVCKDGVAFMQWQWDNISDHYLTKFKNLIVVDTKVKKINDVEHFNYVGFTHYQGTSADAFRDMIMNNKIYVDLRLHTQYNKNKAVRNHGTALRISHANVSKLYTSQEYFN